MTTDLIPTSYFLSDHVQLERGTPGTVGWDSWNVTVLVPTLGTGREASSWVNRRFLSLDAAKEWAMISDQAASELFVVRDDFIRKLDALRESANAKGEGEP